MISVNEVWNGVVGLEKFFEVSNFGRVRSLTDQYNILGRICLRKGKIIHDPDIHPKRRKFEQYFKVNLRDYDTGVCNNYRVHRLVCEAFVDNTDSKPFVNHIDGNKHNNRADNLEWVTESENVNHAIRLGLINFPVGNDAKNRTVSECTLQKIHDSVFKGVIPLRNVDKKFGLSIGYCSRVLIQKAARQQELFKMGSEFSTEIDVIRNILKRRRSKNQGSVFCDVVNEYFKSGDILRLTNEY